MKLSDALIKIAESDGGRVVIDVGKDDPLKLARAIRENMKRRGLYGYSIVIDRMTKKTVLHVWKKADLPFTDSSPVSDGEDKARYQEHIDGRGI